MAGIAKRLTSLSFSTPAGYTVSLADLVGPQKTIPLSTRRTREYVRFLHLSRLMSMRSISAAEAGCSTGSTLLHQLHHVVGAIPLQVFLDLDCWTATKPTA